MISSSRENKPTLSKLSSTSLATSDSKLKEKPTSNTWLTPRSQPHLDHYMTFSLLAWKKQDCKVSINQELDLSVKKTSSSKRIISRSLLLRWNTSWRRWKTTIQTRTEEIASHRLSLVLPSKDHSRTVTTCSTSTETLTLSTLGC